MPKYSGKRKSGAAGIYNKSAKVFRKYKGAKKGSQQAQVNKLVKIMKAALGGMDTALAYTPVIATTNTNAGCFCLNLIQQGNGSWNRVGRKVVLKSARLRFAVGHTYAIAAGGNQIGNRLRMVVVWDKSPNGAALPTYDTVFGLTDQTGAEATTLLAPIKYDNMDRFSIVRDCVITPKVEAQTGTIALPLNTANYYEVDEFIQLNGKESVYSGQSNPMTIADVSTGALYVYFRAEYNAADSFMSVLADAFCRLRYSPA